MGILDKFLNYSFNTFSNSIKTFHNCKKQNHCFIKFLILLMICDITGAMAIEQQQNGPQFNKTKLQEIIVEGLGLKTIPNIKNMNISQEEYQTKYAEYLRRINQRSMEENMKYHTATDDFTVETKHLYSFMNTDNNLNYQHLRRKRSVNNNYDLVYIRFDIPTNNSNTSSPSHLHFSTKPTTTELPPISSDNIEESSLNIMLTRQNNINLNPSHNQLSTGEATVHHRRKAKTKSKQNNNKSISLHVYQLIEPYGRLWLETKPISVADIHMHDKKWIQLQVNDAVRTWLDGTRKNLGLEIFCENCFENNIFIIHDSSPYFTSYDESPVLNVVGKMIQREKRSKLRRYRPLISDYITPPKSTACSPNGKKCCRHSLLVNFQDIAGFGFIIQPKLFDAGFCRGRCPLKYNPASHHALLQSLLHEHVEYNVPKPCCAPSKLVDIDILHIDEENNQRLKVSTWYSMRVMECACS